MEEDIEEDSFKDDSDSDSVVDVEKIEDGIEIEEGKFSIDVGKEEEEEEEEEEEREEDEPPWDKEGFEFELLLATDDNVEEIEDCDSVFVLELINLISDSSSRLSNKFSTGENC